jgi:hypothetical protein
MNPKVAVIILNWNGWKDTIECLESLYQIAYPNYDVIVVDNGSKDDSVERIKAYANGEIKVESKFFKYNPKNKPIKVFEVGEEDARRGRFKRTLYNKFDVNRRMILIRNEDNYGFTGGNNIGIKFALSVLSPDYVLLLNNDTVVDRNFLSELVKVAESDDRIGILQSKIFKKGDRSIIDSTGHIFRFGRVVDRGHGERDRGQYDERLDIVSACGAACLYRKEMIEEIGSLNEDFFAYYEDVEFSLRARKSGWKVTYVPKSVVYHKGRGTSKTEPKFIKSDIGHQLLILHLRNWIIVFKEYCTLKHKFFFIVEYLRSTIMSWIGMKLGRNNIGAKPYIIAFKEFLRYSRVDKKWKE